MICFLGKVKNLLLDVLFPRVCVSCRTLIGTDQFSVLCDRCFQKIPVHSTLFCSLCKARLPDNKKMCHFEAQFLLGAVSDYNSKELRDLIHAFKYSFASEAIQPLRVLMETYIRSLVFDFKDFVVVPVPLYRARERSRGFNQSAVLGEFLSKILGVPFVSDGLRRITNTHPQVRMRDHSAREENVSGAFTINPSHNFQNKNIILVDDVFTSGATMREVARILKMNGAKKIVAFVIAKA